jgi:AcrR family transcriptional regulator
MVDEKAPRKYELRKRADAMEETRRRITEATVALHGSVGPARTTVAAIAEAAGVQRHTVYRHFPTDDDLFTACSTHFWALNPWPDPDHWDEVAGPGERLAVALGELYAFYASVEAMMTNVLRDADVLPIVSRSLRSYFDYADGVALRLATAFDGQELTVAAIRHAVDFRTWESLIGRGGLDPAAAVALMVSMVESSTGQR